MISQESEYLAELIRDFPVSISSIETVADIEATIQARYQSLLDRLIDSDPLLAVMDSIDEHDFSSIFGSVAIESHRVLYGGILSNAGNYRQSTEANGGTVFFGPQRGGSPEFTGIPANQIEGELADAFRNLTKRSSDPVSAAVKFYQQFVRIHPFYDANGRICRLLVSVYLDYHKLYVDWDRLQGRGEWLRRLNACHKRQDQPLLYPQYLARLTEYFTSHVQRKSTLDFDE